MDSVCTLVYRHEPPASCAESHFGQKVTGHKPPVTVPPRGTRASPVPPVHARVACLAVSGAAVLGLASPAAAQLPGQGPKTVADTIEYEPPEGVARPGAPDQRTGHVYVAVGVALNGPAGLIVSTVPSTQDIG